MANSTNKKYHIGQTVWPQKNNNGIYIWPSGDNGIELLINQNNINWNSENIQFSRIKNVVKLGITTIPGVELILNEDENKSFDQQPCIRIGRTGFFELDIKDLNDMTINSIVMKNTDRTDPTSDISKIENNYCYIDYIYFTDGSEIS